LEEEEEEEEEHLSVIYILPLTFVMDIVSIKGLADTENYRSVGRHILSFNTDKNSNVSFKGLDIHYH
jgi:hypothetical protein